MASSETFVIAGAGLAGAKAAETLRAEGFGGRIVLAGAEQRRPYERPPLSKGLLLGAAGSPFVHDADWYAGHDVELRTGVTVTAIDRGGRAVVAGPERIPYDKLLLATGSSPRRWPGPGGDLAGVRYLRTWEDSLALAAELTAGRRVTVLGSGWIGLEVAAAARERGAEVTVVTPAPAPLHRVLGERIGGMLAGLHREHGVTFRFGTRVRELLGDDHVRRVLLDDWTAVETDLVVVGIGAVPTVSLAARAGLAVEGGVLVDAYHRTSDPSIFAAGDIAAVQHPLYGRRVRVDHWANALHSGPAAARSMLDNGTPWARVPYFFTDQYDLGLEYAGLLEPGVAYDVVVRGDLDKRECLVFWTSEGRVAAGMNVNVWDVTDRIQDLITAGRPVDPARLADPAVPLEELIPQA
ncbi:NAD(P)/FAD-dependent oxidoreductase [Symbioplanes lichenis]|uniref:NAD(P)/FAD-dependent oxidoreductase n=1 Tax=Symbioplanes lichenis TaxID=1629072 RepID=UPI00273999EE|nr:FAD-dependent oxidoreductase [Actinoplanes lichenis]